MKGNEPPPTEKRYPK